MIRDRSLTITEKISTAVIPATTVTRIKRKGTMTREEGSHPMEKVDKNMEARIDEIEQSWIIFHLRR